MADLTPDGMEIVAIKYVPGSFEEQYLVHCAAAWREDKARIEELERAVTLMTAERDALASELLGRLGECDGSDQ